MTMVELNEKFPDHRFDGAKEVPSRTSDSSAPDGGLEVVARLGGINGVKLQRHIEDMRPEARVEYNDRPALVRLSDAQAALQSKDEQIERLTRERGEWRDHVHKQNANVAHNLARAEALEQQVQKLTAENERLREAMTPSGDTKAAYMGEFSISNEQWNVEGDDTETVQIAVPWTTIKEIMAAIRARSALETQEGGE